MNKLLFMLATMITVVASIEIQATEIHTGKAKNRVCGNSSSVSLTTSCEPITQLPWTTGFESDEDNQIPDCWNTLNSYQGYPSVKSSPVYSYAGNKMLEFHANTEKSIAVLPAFATSLDELQLSFYTRREGPSSGTLYIGYVTDVTNANTFVIVDSITSASIEDNDYHLYEVPFLNVTISEGVTPRIAFAYTCQYNWYWYVDNITVEEMPACTRPNQISTSVTSSTATINWTSTGTDFEVYYKVSDTAEYTLANDFSATDLTDVYTITLENLTPVTQYSYYIKAICEDTIQSEIKTFKTGCVALTSVPQSWGFETYEQDTYLPTCWTNVSTNGYSTSRATDYYANSGSYSLSVESDCYTVLPLIDSNQVDINSLQLRFYAMCPVYSFMPSTLEVGVMTDVTDVSTFEVISSVGVTTGLFEEKQVIFSAYQGNGQYIAIRKQNGGGSTYIDDVNLEIIPDCPPVQNIVATSITSDSVTLTWVGNNNSYLVRYKAEGDAQWRTDNITSSGASAIISGLSANTNYIVSVAPDCEDITDSTYRTLEFTTLCATENIPYNMDFENESVFNCWTIASQSTDMYYYTQSIYPYIDSLSSNANSSTHSLMVGGANNTAMVIVAPKVNLNIEQTRLQFCVRKLSLSGLYGTNQFGNIEIGIMTNPNDTNTFVSLTSIEDSLITTDYSWQTIDFNQFTQYTGNNYYVAIKYLGKVASYTYSCGRYCIDDIKINLIPSCAEATGIAVSNITPNSVDISWTSGATDFKVYYKPITAGDDIEYSSVSASLTNGVYTLQESDMQPATTYDFYVATICSDSTESNSLTYTFTTACVALTTVPQSWDIETWSENTGIPYCWTKIGSYPIASGHLSSQSLCFNGLCTGVLPQIDTFALSLDTLQLSFTARMTSYDGYLEVGVMTDPADTSTFTVVSSIDVSRVDVIYEVPFIAYNGNGTYIALRTTLPNVTIYVDDVTLDVIPACSRPNNVETTATADQVTVSWVSTGESFEVYYKEYSATDYNTPITTVTAGETSGTWTATITGFNPATLYNVYVKAICSEESQPQSQVVTFRTECATITNFPYTEDFETFSNEDFVCWTNEIVTGSSSWKIRSLYQGDTVVYGTFDAGSTYLISPVFDITSIISPKLSYNWEVCENNYNGGKDSLYVCYRTNSTSDWTILASHGTSYTGYFTGSVLTQADTIVLPNASNTYQIAFLASCHGGYGVYLDNVVINGNGVVTPVEPTVATNVATNIAQTTATLNGAITDAGNQTITAKGFEWKATNGGTYTQVLSTATGNTLTYNLTNLTANTSYTYKAFATTANGTVYGTEQVFTTLQAGDEPCTPLTASITETLCYGETFTFNGQTYTTSGTYTTTVAGQNGDCDTLYTINLTILPQNTASITETLCYGETFTFNGQTYNATGTYNTTVAGQNGDCDTLYTINLTILPQNTASITETLCYGETFTFNGQTYNATGTYTTTVAGQNGDCDTLYTINLTILPQNTATVTETLCYGETFTFNGQTYNATGTYTTTVAGQNGDCDTLYTINLTILPQNTASITETLCYGETFTFNGQTYNATGTYNTTVAGQSGDCDTLYTINLTILPQNTASITETLCYGETFTFNGQTYNATGTYNTTVAGQNGDCDTLYTINLTILPQNTPINDEVTISQSELPYSYHGQTYSDFGSYTLTTQDENGCDQVYNLTLVHNSGISEVEGVLTISLYPNPTDNNATLRVKGLSEQATIIITDQQGRVVSSKVLAQGVETLEIETTNLASGVYYIRIQTANTIKTEKLIKK